MEITVVQITAVGSHVVVVILVGGRGSAVEFKSVPEHDLLLHRRFCGGITSNNPFIMGIHRQMSNVKRNKVHTKPYRLQRQRRAEKKRVHGVVHGEIMDPELVTVHQLSKRRSSQRANITLSGKKKTKLLRQIKRSQVEKSKMEADEIAEVSTSTVREIEMAEPSGSKKAKAKKSKKQRKAAKKQEVDDAEDIEMADT